MMSELALEPKTSLVAAGAQPPMAWRPLLARERARGRVVAAIDVGSHKVVCYMARVGRNGFDVLGRGYQAAEGVGVGEIIDHGAAQDSVAGALDQAEKAAGEPVREATLVFGGRRTRTIVHRTACALGGRRACDEDVASMLEDAAHAASGSGLTVLRATPLRFAVDGGRAHVRHDGLAGQRLVMEARLVVAETAALAPVIEAVERCHVRVKDVAPAGYAAALAVTHADEIERGVLTIDFGGGSAALCAMGAGKLAWLDVVDHGGDQVTTDLAYILETGVSQAERLKNLFGCATPRICDDNARISYPLLDDMIDQPTGEAPRALLTRVIRPRVEEILVEARAKLDAAEDLVGRRPPRSIVLTGGSSQLEGVEDLVEEIFGMPARQGRPVGLLRRDPGDGQPCCAAAGGALALAAGEDGGLSWGARRSGGGVLRFGFSQLRRWLNECF